MGKGFLKNPTEFGQRLYIQDDDNYCGTFLVVYGYALIIIKFKNTPVIIFSNTNYQHQGQEYLMK